MQAVRKPSFTSPPPRKARGLLHVDPRAVLRRRGEHGVGDRGGTQAVGERRRAVGQRAAAHGLVEVGHEGVEAVGVALRMAAGERSRTGGRGARASRGRGGRWSSDSRLPHQSSSGCSWSNASASSAPVELDPEPVLAACRDLADHDRAERATVGLELDERRVLGRHGSRVARRRAGPERVPPRLARALRHSGEQASREPGDAMAGDELGEVAPVRADVGERARGAAELVVDAPVVVVRAEEPVLKVRAVQQVQRTGPPAARHARAPRGRSGSSGRRTGRAAWRPELAARSASRCAPSRSVASGFSQTTCLPAASAASASGRCRWFGVQTWTTSTSESRPSLRPSRTPDRAEARPRRPRDSGDEAATAASSAPARRSGSCVDAPDEPCARDRGSERHRTRER